MEASQHICPYCNGEGTITERITAKTVYYSAYTVGGRLAAVVLTTLFYGGAAIATAGGLSWLCNWARDHGHPFIRWVCFWTSQVPILAAGWLIVQLVFMLLSVTMDAIVLAAQNFWGETVQVFSLFRKEPPK